MNTKHLKGLAVISIADGRKLGTVDEVYVDPEARRIVAFGVHHGGGLLHGGSHGATLVTAEDVHALGADALTLDSDAALREGDLRGRPELVSTEDLIKRKVVTEGGTYVGQIVSAEFDPRTLALASIEASPGFFKSNKVIPNAQISSLGADVIVVADAVCASSDDRAEIDESALAGEV